ncbi:MAG: lysophospholipid acyltransferase family protein [Gammaproteobacteria bacterium]
MLNALLRFCSWLPLRLAHGLGALIGQLAWLLKTESCRTTRRNIDLCFTALSASEREDLSKKSLIETAKTACELGQVWIRPPEASLRKIIKTSGKEHLEAAIAKGTGIIILAPHLGNWELCGLFLDSCGPSTYLYKPPKLTAFEPKMLHYRGRLGAKLAPTSAKGVAMLLKALSRGELVGILPDQEPNWDSGVFAPFFGNDALTMTLVAKLANRTEATVLSIFARRLDKSTGFEIVIQPAREGVASEDGVAAATALNATVEDCVRLAPEQYQWEYRRFKRQADRTKNTLYR